MTIVEVEGGRLQGRPRQGLVLFAGIPFAAAPVGPRRWRPPAAHPGWSGVRDATRFAPIVWQTPNGYLGEPSEDCLYLNVQTPSLTGGPRPVIVWIHGGGFTSGSGSAPLYDTTTLVRARDVVAVTFNYRLGALGWLHLSGHSEEYPDSGTNGLHDQLRALTWVRDNIGSFGGDPTNVTVVGHSAGAVSVASLLASPAAEGLLHHAICQSGAADHVKSPELASEVTDRLLRRLEVRSVDELIGLPADRLLAAQAAVEVGVSARQWQEHPGASRLLAFGPVVGEPLLPRHPHTEIAAGRTRSVPVIVGTTHDEMTGRVSAGRSGEDLAHLAEHLEIAREELLSLCETADADEAYRTLRVDLDFRLPAIRLAEANAPRASTYLYEFRWSRSDLPTGSAHGLEIPFVFDNLHKPGVPIAMVGPDPPRDLTDAMQGAWTTFARLGRPVLPGDSTWEPYGKTRHTMAFDDRCTLVDDPGVRRRLALQQAVDRRAATSGPSG